MKIIHCPVNGPRPLQEFIHGGEVSAETDPSLMTDDQWADQLFNRRGEPGVVKEWWYHAPSGTWFVAERDNVADRILRTYLYGDEAPHE